MDLYSGKNNINEFVFPILKYNEENGKMKFERILGTGFLIGKRGYALTASHVLGTNSENVIVSFYDYVQKIYIPIRILEFAHHDNEDVCLIKLPNFEWKSPFRLSTEWEGSWREYLTCGYPFDLLYENKQGDDIFKRANLVPELLFTRGYIRRRVNKSLNISNVRGQCYFEMSTLAGMGCSGSPVFIVRVNKIWDVIGIYTAEKVKHFETNDKIKWIEAMYSYATRVEAFRNWKPSIIDNTIGEEADNFFV